MDTWSPMLKISLIQGDILNGHLVPSVKNNFLSIIGKYGGIYLKEHFLELNLDLNFLELVIS